MTAPEITAAIDALIANTPQPVTVWGVRPAELVRITGRVHPADATVTDGGAR